MSSKQFSKLQCIRVMYNPVKYCFVQYVNSLAYIRYIFSSKKQRSRSRSVGKKRRSRSRSKQRRQRSRSRSKTRKYATRYFITLYYCVHSIHRLIKFSCADGVFILFRQKKERRKSRSKSRDRKRKRKDKDRSSKSKVNRDYDEEEKG